MIESSKFLLVTYEERMVSSSVCVVLPFLWSDLFWRFKDENYNRINLYFTSLDIDVHPKKP